MSQTAVTDLTDGQNVNRQNIEPEQVKKKVLSCQRKSDESHLVVC